MDEASKAYLRSQLARDPSLAHVVFQFDGVARTEAETNRSLALARILNEAIQPADDYFSHNAR